MSYFTEDIKKFAIEKKLQNDQLNKAFDDTIKDMKKEAPELILFSSNLVHFDKIMNDIVEYYGQVGKKKYDEYFVKLENEEIKGKFFHKKNSIFTCYDIVKCEIIENRNGKKRPKYKLIVKKVQSPSQIIKTQHQEFYAMLEYHNNYNKKLLAMADNDIVPEKVKCANDGVLLGRRVI